MGSSKKHQKQAVKKAQQAAQHNRAAQEERARELASKLQERADKANAWAQKEIAPRFQEQIDRATPVVENAVNTAREKASEAAVALAGKLDSADVPPQLQTAVAKVSGGDKKALKKYQKQAAQAAKDFAKQQKKATKKSHKGLVFCGLIVAGAAAGVAAWRASRPVEDPWKTPADPAPAAPQTPVAQTKTAEPARPAVADETVRPAEPKAKDIKDS